jgi:methylated-DNA-[protein]-cysteine S-methyltransferase
MVQRVGFGETKTYRDIAAELGSNKFSRAVGMANGKNPIPIIIPCHRIIGANGKLTGYSGGLERKRWLLVHEQTDVLMK